MLCSWNHDKLVPRLLPPYSDDAAQTVRSLLIELEPHARVAGHGPVLDGWGEVDLEQPRRLAGENTPTRLIGLKLGRTEDAVRDKARKLEAPLAPANRPLCGDMP